MTDSPVCEGLKKNPHLLPPFDALEYAPISVYVEAQDACNYVYQVVTKGLFTLNIFR